MKRAYQTILLMIMAIAIAIPADAREQRKGKPSRDQLAQVQAQKIAEELKLDDNASKQFVTAFTQCQKEVWNSRPANERRKRDKNADMTDAEAQQIIKERFAHRQKINEIQEKYYAEYSKFLTQKQILKVYDLEKKMMDKMFRERMNRHGKRGDRRATGQPCPVAPQNCPRNK